MSQFTCSKLLSDTSCHINSHVGIFKPLSDSILVTTSPYFATGQSQKSFFSVPLHGPVLPFLHTGWFGIGFGGWSDRAGQERVMEKAAGRDSKTLVLGQCILSTCSDVG